MPEQVADWTRTGAPKQTTPIGGARRAWKASYRGRPDVQVVLAEMPAAASAFEAVQKRRPSAGELTFYKGRYFGIAHSPGANQAMLNRFVNAFEDAMPK